MKITNVLEVVLVALILWLFAISGVRILGHYEATRRCRDAGFEQGVMLFGGKVRCTTSKVFQ